MPKWLESLLGFIYARIPLAIRPAAKSAFINSLLVSQAIGRRRRLLKAERIAFVDQEVADVEPYRFLGPGRGEVTIGVEASTISPGTETAVLCGLPGARRMFPYFPGYSSAGTVRYVGRGKGPFEPGDRVAGRVPHAELATVPSSNLFSVPDSVDLQSASFIELGIIVLQGIRKARIRPGDTVAVLGQGLIGQLSNRVVRAMGAGKVIALATSRRRADTAIAAGGAHEFRVIKGEASARGVGADVVIEAVGVPQATQTALHCVAPGGRVVLLGSARGLSRDFDVKGLIRDPQVEVIGAHIGAMPARDGSPGRWTYRQEGQLFLKLLESGRLSVRELITWRPEPREVNAVYERLANGGGSEVAIVINW